MALVGSLSGTLFIHYISLYSKYVSFAIFLFLGLMMLREALKKENIDISEVIHLDTLIKSENAVFSATGITSGGYLDGVKFHENGTITTKSVVISAKSGSIRFIEGIHNKK